MATKKKSQAAKVELEEKKVVREEEPKTYWSMTAEMLFIRNLGTQSEEGKMQGKATCLRGYIHAMKTLPSADEGWTKEQASELIAFAQQELADHYAQIQIEVKRV